MSDLIEFLKPCSPAEVLHALGEAKAKNPQQDISVEIALRGGGSVRGLVGKFGEDRNSQGFMILLPEEKSSDLIYIQTQDAVAVRIFRAFDLKKVLSFGTYPEHLSQQQRSPLQAKRDISQLSVPIPLEVLWDTFPKDDFVPGGVFLFAQRLSEALAEISGDDLGRAAIKTISKIVIASTDKATAFEKGPSVSALFNVQFPIPTKNEMIQLLNPHL